ncbi:MAG: hypothetical protein GWP06_00300 [Actinobacteria bacterium]|nr:hypothetical protein [Actinomycetota bacterium]
MSLQTQAVKIAGIAHKLSGTTVFLIDPDGVKTEHDDCTFLSGRVTQSPDSGEEMVVFRPVATFPRSSLTRIPADGEKWALLAPLDPEIPDTLTTLSLDPSKAIEGGRSLGTIRLYLSEVKQS